MTKSLSQAVREITPPITKVTTSVGWRPRSSVSTQQIAFAIRGMFCAKCPGDIERALAELDGVVAAQVNYATERATVVYDPARVTVFQMVQAIRQKGFDTPLEHLVLHSDDLLYATCAQSVENALARAEGVARVSADLAARSVTLDILPEYSHRGIPARVLARFGFRTLEGGSSSARRLFLLRAVILLGIELLAVWSAGAHAGLLPAASLVHAPLLLMVLSFITLFIAGLPFFRFGYDAALQGQFDATVIAALLASGFAIGSLPLGILMPSPWLIDIGFVTATTLTAGWFSARALTFWVFPRFRGAAHKVNRASAAHAQLGVISDGAHQGTH